MRVPNGRLSTNKVINDILRDQGYGYYMVVVEGGEEKRPSRLYPDYESVEPFTDDTLEDEELDVGVENMESRIVHWDEDDSNRSN